jgi:type II secretion system protein G
MKKGFTLIELLVVISIISILTIITVSQFQTAKKKANDVARKGDLSALSKALLMYYADYGKFPPSDSGMIRVTDNVPPAVAKDIEWGGEFSDNAVPPYVYMKVMPKEKNVNFPFCYVADPTGQKFGLFAMLESTTDSQCIMNGANGMYNHCGKHYCFAYVSPNAVVTDLNGL